MRNGKISRRDFLVRAGLVTAVGLTGCGGDNSSEPFAPSQSLQSATVYDLVVVGAGIPGITAARTAQGYGGKVLVIEAQSYVGGRALCDNTTFPEIPFDLGAQFFQQVLSGNDLWQIAVALDLNPVDLTDFPQLLFDGAAVADEITAADFESTAGAVSGAILAFGAAAQGDAASDQAIEETIGLFAQDPFFNLVTSIEIDTEADSVKHSTIDLFNLLLPSPGAFATPGDNFVIRSGMGNFIESLGTGLDIRLNTAVESISRTSQGVTIRTTGGEQFQARTVIVTASMGVLAAGAIHFDPPLPPQYTADFASLPMGHLYKALMGFRNTDAFQTLDGFSTVIPLLNEPSLTYFPRFWGTDHVEFLGGGELALDLETMGRDAAIADLLARLEVTFPGCSADFDGRFTQNSWTGNPFTRGVYTAALPGQFPARTRLAQPIDDQLWFAGEAVAPGGSHSSLHGAYRTGISSGTAAMRALGLVVAVP